MKSLLIASALLTLGSCTNDELELIIDHCSHKTRQLQGLKSNTASGAAASGMMFIVLSPRELQLCADASGHDFSQQIGDYNGLYAGVISHVTWALTHPDDDAEMGKKIQPLVTQMANIATQVTSMLNEK